MKFYLCEKAPQIGSTTALTLLPKRLTSCPWCGKPFDSHPMAIAPKGSFSAYAVLREDELA